MFKYFQYYNYNMKTTKKIVKIAYSLGIIIDKPIIEKLKLKKGDYVEMDVKKAK